MSITSETISHQTICGDNEGLELTNDMEYSKEQTEFEKMQNNLQRAREVYFKYFPSQGMAHTKATVRKRAMMGMKMVPQPQIRKKVSEKKVKKGKTPRIGIKNLGKIKHHLATKLSQHRRFRPSTWALWETRKYQKMTNLLILKMPFLRLVWEILQRACFPLNPSKCSFGTAWGCGILPNYTNGRHKPVHNSHQKSNNFT